MYTIATGRNIKEKRWRKMGKKQVLQSFLEFRTGTPFTCCSGVFQRVRCTDGVSGLGGTSHSSLVSGTNPELVQTSFLESTYRVVAHFLNVHIAAHPLTLAHITSGKEVTKERRGYEKSHRSDEETKKEIHL